MSQRAFIEIHHIRGERVAVYVSQRLHNGWYGRVRAHDGCFDECFASRPMAEEAVRAHVAKAFPDHQCTTLCQRYEPQ